MTGPPLTERSIQDGLYAYLFTSGSIVIPCYTPKNWLECDMFAVTKAGYSTEYEIKLTMVDFKADARKTVRVPDRFRREKKHELINVGYIRGPGRFYYVVPKGLLTAVDVPKWAGLLVAESYLDYYTRKPRVSICEIKEAPSIHRQKVDPKVIDHIKSMFFHRYWNLRRHGRESMSVTVPVAVNGPVAIAADRAEGRKF